MQMTLSKQYFVLADLIAAMILGVVQGLIGMSENDNGSFLCDAGKAEADRDLTHLRE